MKVKSGQMTDKKDASERDIEAEFMNFAVAIGEGWFKWIGWAIVLGLLRYASIVSEEPTIEAIYYLSHFVLVFYFIGLAGNFMNRNIHSQRPVGHMLTALVFCLTATFLIAAGSFHIARAFAEIEGEAQPE